MKSEKSNISEKVISALKVVVFSPIILSYKIVEKFHGAIAKERKTLIYKNQDKYRKKALKELELNVISQINRSYRKPAYRTYHIYHSVFLDGAMVVDDFFKWNRDNNKISYRYKQALDSEGQKVDYKWFFENLLKELEKYEDLEVTKTIEKIWEDDSVWAKDHEVIIVKTKYMK